MRLRSARLRAAVVTASAALFVLVSPVTAHHKDDHDSNGNNGNHNGWFKRDPLPPSVASTPELGSLLLFGTGLAGAGGYALTRLRARRRSD